ncbi:MAG: hypothetical protein NFCOHLIN_01926 [Gammaproteobacteria bacterium]|nr:hypothetical protein [Gammaproteobacteria bacterium]
MHMRIAAYFLAPLLLAGCATEPVDAQRVLAEGSPWRTDRYGGAAVLAWPSWPETYQICTSPRSAAAVSVSVRDRPSLRTIRDMVPRLAAGECATVTVDRDQDLVVTQLAGGAAADGRSLRVHGTGYRPPAPAYPLIFGAPHLHRRPVP